jgi:hypothetical protein
MLVKVFCERRDEARAKKVVDNGKNFFSSGINATVLILIGKHYNVVLFKKVFARRQDTSKVSDA